MLYDTRESQFQNEKYTWINALSKYNNFFYRKIPSIDLISNEIVIFKWETEKEFSSNEHDTPKLDHSLLDNGKNSSELGRAKVEHKIDTRLSFLTDNNLKRFVSCE